MSDLLLKELSQEAAITRRVLERVPEDKLDWRPHPKSMSLGELALHVANIPGNVSKLIRAGEFDASQTTFTPPAPGSLEEIFTAYDTSLKDAQEYLDSVDEKTAQEGWRLTFQGKEVFSSSRGEVIRTVMMNHWYHHRGQLSVYLRLLDVPLPIIYGRSADESPFA
ncbi:MAG: DinB family protein [Blastocatellia bacterium]|nr:DinB family protein [Blastocatellia bacterium]